MKKKTVLDEQDLALFREAAVGTRQIKQDTISPTPKPVKQKALLREVRETLGVSHYFSDEFVPHLSEEGPMRYVRGDVSSFEVKRLRRGDYYPDMLLDLHGLSQQQAKLELAALLQACRRQHIRCACVMHGHGKNVLKQKVPLWLAQHPLVEAFHQAPKAWGGDAALLVLIEQSDPLAAPARR